MPKVTSLRPTIPAPTVLPDGRIGWPTVFEYKIHDGVRGDYVSPCPPRLQVDSERWPNPTPAPREPCTWPFEVIVYDLPAYDALTASGLLADPRHRGAE